MAKEYSKEQFWKLYEKLPEELKEAVSSADTADYIWNACEKSGIDEVSEVAKLVGNVLLGVLPIEDFQEILEKELKLEKEVAKKVTQEINRLIFYPVKPALEQLYKIEIGPSVTTTEKIKSAEETEKKAEAPGRKDTYREEIE